MADSFTPNLNLRKPEVGFAADTWGGIAGLNNDLDLLDAVFLATGLGTGVGIHIGATQTLFCEGTLKVADATDNTKVMELLTSNLPTATTVQVQAPPASGTMATQEYVLARLPTGTVLNGYYGIAAPPGYVRAGGLTIGSAASTATERANVDTLTLFTLLWNRFLGANVVGGAGASAAADWTANKQLTLPDHSGRVAATRDDMSGTNRGNLGTIASTTIGAVGGAAATTVSIGVNLTSTGSITAGTAVAAAGTGAPNIAGTSDHVSVSGSGTFPSGSFSITQPTIMVDTIIAL